MPEHLCQFGKTGFSIVLTLPVEYAVQVVNHRIQGALLDILGAAKRDTRGAFVMYMLT